MKNGVFVATDYLTNYYEATPSGNDVVTDTLKMALLLYEYVDVDLDKDTVKQNVQRISDQIEAKKDKNKLGHCLRSIASKNVKFQLEPDFDTSVAVGAAYEALCEKEGAWFAHWPVGVLRATELAKMVVTYELYCNEYHCEFYSSSEHREMVDKILHRMKAGFSKDGPVNKLINNIKTSDFLKSNFAENKGAPPSIVADHTKFTDHLHSLADALEKHVTTANIAINQVKKPEDKAIHTLLLPSPRDLSWNDIAKLRRSSNREYFLKHQFGDIDSSSPVEITSYFVEQIFDLLSKKRPEVVRNVAHRVISNLPVPVIGLNPYSLGRASKETIEEIQEIRNYGWIYFVAEANLLARAEREDKNIDTNF